LALQAPLSPLDRDLLRQQAIKSAAREQERDFLVGLSVGQGLQPTGVAVLERLMPEPPRRSRTYACRYLRRWLPPATAYPNLVSNLRAMLTNTPLRGSDLVVEAGPGIKAVVSYLRKNRLPRPSDRSRSEPAPKTGMSRACGESPRPA
jgi:hypothetical protein